MPPHWVQAPPQAMGGPLVGKWVVGGMQVGRVPVHTALSTPLLTLFPPTKQLEKVCSSSGYLCTPPCPHRCSLCSRQQSNWRKSVQALGTSAPSLVHTAAHSVPANKAIGESLFKLWVPLHPVCLGYHLTEVVTQVRAIADEKLHTTLHTDISMVLGRPLQHKFLSRPDLGHG